MLHPSTKKLIDRLAEMTERGKLNWEEGENDAVVYATEGYSVALTNAPDELIITSKDGKQLERADEAELAEATTETGGSYTEVVANMKREASRIARGTEAAISTLLAGIDLDGDGIPDISVDADDDETELVEASEPEDVADETSAVSVEEVESLEADDTLEAEEETDAAPADIEAHDEEPDMTEAVARLADEVNGRDGAEEIAASTLTAAAGGLAAAVAMAETSDTEETAEEVETVEVEAEPIATEAVETIVDTDRYVPFGLETAETVVTAEAAPVEEASEPVELADAPAEDTIAPMALATASVTEFASAAVETVTETTSDVGEELVETVTETVSKTSETITETVETITTDATEVAEVMTEIADESTDNVVSFAAETAPKVGETVEQITPITASLDETPEAASEAPRSFSLSGIGAGFGLGALSATTEASGVPGATAAPESVAEKIVIDATDEVPMTEPSAPAAEAAPTPAPAETVVEPTEEVAPEDSDTMLKPRTRFNPWD
ncbi:MAG: hypothetical protein P8H62_01290 [Henriciella sp.]|nr:hypothetical protein [Henriciella sp.]